MQLTFATPDAGGAATSRTACTGLRRARCASPPTGSPIAICCAPRRAFTTARKLTAHDVAFSLKLLKEKGHPIIGQLTRDFLGAEAEDDATVVLKFAPKRARDVPLFVAGLPIFSRAYYSTRNFDETTLEAPLGSGPYKVGRFESGRYIEYDRVKDWWGADLPIARGQNNFDIVRFEFYRDRDVGFEGFTGEELSVPRGIHRAHLGDALRFSRRQGRPRQAGDAARRHAVGRAGLVHEHAARQVQEPPAARSARSTRSISSGPTRPSCTAPTSARSRCSRIPT